MKTDTLIKQEGMDALVNQLGFVDAERFIMLIMKEPFDYTRWREENLNKSNMSVRELSRLAMESIEKD